MTRRVCAWCREELGRIPDGPDGVTHGICRPCKRRVLGTEIGRCLDAAFDGAAWAVLVFGYLAAAWMLYDILVPPAPAGETMRVAATAYSWREPSHRRWGKSNAIGGRLDRPVQGLEQIAVDPAVIPQGSIVEIPGAGRRIATDTGAPRLGGKIAGRKIDMHWQSLGEMNAWGTRIVQIEILRFGWGGGGEKKIWSGGGVENRRHAPDVRRGQSRKTSTDVARTRSRSPDRPAAPILIALDSKGRRRPAATIHRKDPIIAVRAPRGERPCKRS